MRIAEGGWKRGLANVHGIHKKVPSVLWAVRLVASKPPLEHPAKISACWIWAILGNPGGASRRYR